MMVSCNMMAYISGDGFPFSTSSPPTIVEKHSFHPIQDKYRYTNNYIYIYKKKRKCRIRFSEIPCWQEILASTLDLGEFEAKAVRRHPITL